MLNEKKSKLQNSIYPTIPFKNVFNVYIFIGEHLEEYVSKIIRDYLWGGGIHIFVMFTFLCKAWITFAKRGGKTKQS